MRASRLVSILLSLQLRGRMTARQLAERLEVSERTVYRDLEALGAAGVPIVAERGPHGGYSLLDGYRTDLTGLTPDEAQALFALGVPGPLGDLGLGPLVAGAHLKLLAALPPSLREAADHARDRFLIDSSLWFRAVEDVPHLGALQHAVWHDRRVRLAYERGDGSQVRRTLDPVALVLKGVVWYLVASDRRGPRVFRVSRVRDVEILDDHVASRPAGFELEGFWRKWSEEFEASRPRLPVVVRVPRDLAPMLPQVLGDAARAMLERAREDGDALLVKLSFESMDAACARVLLLGPDVEVVSPASLRRQVAATATAIAERYRHGRRRHRKVEVSEPTDLGAALLE